jgi:hypothetical protein
VFARSDGAGAELLVVFSLLRARLTQLSGLAGYAIANKLGRTCRQPETDLELSERPRPS